MEEEKEKRKNWRLSPKFKKSKSQKLQKKSLRQRKQKHSPFGFERFVRSEFKEEIRR